MLLWYPTTFLPHLSPPSFPFPPLLFSLLLSSPVLSHPSTPLLSPPSSPHPSLSPLPPLLASPVYFYPILSYPILSYPILSLFPSPSSPLPPPVSLLSYPSSCIPSLFYFPLLLLIDRNLSYLISSHLTLTLLRPSALFYCTLLMTLIT